MPWAGQDGAGLGWGGDLGSCPGGWVGVGGSSAGVLQWVLQDTGPGTQSPTVAPPCPSVAPSPCRPPPSPAASPLGAGAQERQRWLPQRSGGNLCPVTVLAACPSWPRAGCLFVPQAGRVVAGEKDTGHRVPHPEPEAPPPHPPSAPAGALHRVLLPRDLIPAREGEPGAAWWC